MSKKNEYPAMLPSSESIQKADKGSEFEKHSSLINILKGFEEYTLDASGVIISSNLEAINITGYEEWEVIGKKISIFYSVEDQLKGKPFEDLAKATARGSLTFTGLWMKKRNSSFLARIKIKTLEEGGVLSGFKMILQDATYKAVNNLRLKKVRDEYLNLFNNSFVGIVKFNMHDFSVFMINDKAEKMIAAINTRDKLKFSEIFETEHEFSELRKKLHDTKKVEDFQFQLRGTDRWLMASLRYFTNEDFSEGILIDVTDVRRKDSELERLNHELDQLIYHASHELRAPLSSMLGIVNLIRLDKNCDTTRSEYSDLLERKIHKLDSLLRNIVAISYNNKKEVIVQKIHWKEILRSCISVPEMNRAKIQVETEVAESANFSSDKDRVKIIIYNVISNALKYYNPNLEQPKINIKVLSNKEVAEIMISDNGVGIDEKYLKKIFDMFYRANANSSDGHGLGLYIVKVMTDRLGGSITVKSTLGEGTAFCIVLPNMNGRVK